MKFNLVVFILNAMLIFDDRMITEEDGIVEIINREIRISDTKDVELLVSVSHEDMI